MKGRYSQWQENNGTVKVMWQSELLPARIVARQTGLKLTRDCLAERLLLSATKGGLFASGIHAMAVLLLSEYSVTANLERNTLGRTKILKSIYGSLSLYGQSDEAIVASVMVALLQALECDFMMVMGDDKDVVQITLLRTL